MWLAIRLLDEQRPPKSRPLPSISTARHASPPTPRSITTHTPPAARQGPSQRRPKKTKFIRKKKKKSTHMRCHHPSVRPSIHLAARPSLAPSIAPSLPLQQQTNTTSKELDDDVPCASRRPPCPGRPHKLINPPPEGFVSLETGSADPCIPSTPHSFVLDASFKPTLPTSLLSLSLFGQSISLGRSLTSRLRSVVSQSVRRRSVEPCDYLLPQPPPPPSATTRLPGNYSFPTPTPPPPILSLPPSPVCEGKKIKNKIKRRAP